MSPQRFYAVALLLPLLLLLLIVVPAWLAAAAAGEAGAGYPPICRQWQTISTADGLPNDHIFWVEADRVRNDRIWLGTENGLVSYRIADGAITTWQPADGLGHRAVMSVEVDEETGDVWAATFGGLSWLSGGKIITTFTQSNSGLANDVVYAVVAYQGEIWAATTAGTSRFDPTTGEWKIYTSANMPSEENWCYNLSANDGKVIIAAWGGGIIEYDVASDAFKAYHDPDGEFEIELFPNDGLVHNITTSPCYESGLLWATTYFGLSVYDQRRWRSYFDHDSGLASNFINFGRAMPGTHIGWLCTDKGLSVLDRDSNRWVTYKPDPEHHGKGMYELWNGGDRIAVEPTGSTIAHQFVLSIDFTADEVWVGTAHGLSRCRPSTAPTGPTGPTGTNGSEGGGTAADGAEKSDAMGGGS